MHLINSSTKKVIWIFSSLPLVGVITFITLLIIRGFFSRNLLVALSMSLAYAFFTVGLVVLSIAVYQQALNEYSLVLKPGGKSRFTDVLQKPDSTFYQRAFSFLSSRIFSKKRGSYHRRKVYGKVYLSSFSLTVAFIIPILQLLPPQFIDWIIYLIVTGLVLYLVYFSFPIFYIPFLLAPILFLIILLAIFLKELFLVEIVFISGIAALPIANYLMKPFRNLPLYIDAVNRQPMQRVGDEITNKQLSEPEKVAQQLGTVSFEGWQPTDCNEEKDIHTLAFVLPSAYQECPECKELTVGKTEKYASPGIHVITYQCHCCDYSHEEEKRVSKKTRSSSRSVFTSYGGYGGSSGSSSGDSGGGGSSFGGGDSGGGGAGGDF